MNKNIAIVIGIILVGAVLYATGVFAQPWEEPIEPSADIIEGSWKQTVTVQYTDGTSETFTGDNPLGKILYNEQEMDWIECALYVKPINPAGYDYTTVEMQFGEPTDSSMARIALHCVGGDAYDNLGLGKIFSGAGYNIDVYGTPIGTSGESTYLENAGWMDIDIDGIFHPIAVVHFSNVYFEAIAGWGMMGANGDWELTLSYCCDDYIDFRILSESSETYTIDAPTSELVISFSTVRNHNVGGITFDWDTI